VQVNSDIDMQIVARDKSVMLLFSRVSSDTGTPVPAFTDNMLLDPETALRASQLMADMAFEADDSIKPVGPALKAALVEKHRAVLIPRIAMILNTLREKKTVTNEQLAVQLVDVTCAEIFT